jgi:hypothetical protein
MGYGTGSNQFLSAYDTAQHEQYPTFKKEGQTPIYGSGGFGYGAARNDRMLAYIGSLGYETLPALPDQAARMADTRFTISIGGLTKVVSWRQAIRYSSSQQVEHLSSNYQQEKADRLIKMLEEKGQSNINAIFQSADAINGIKVLEQKPNLIGSAILAYPAGLIAQPRLLKTSIEAVRGGWKAVPRSPSVAEENFFILDDGSRTAKARSASSFAVAASAALSDHSSLLHEIRSRDEAPGISLVLGTRDPLFRRERVLASLQSPEDIDAIVITGDPYGTHGVGGRKTEIKSLLELFPVMEAARNARREGLNTIEPLTSRMIFLGEVAVKKQQELLAVAAAVGKSQ